MSAARSRGRKRRANKLRRIEPVVPPPERRAAIAPPAPTDGSQIVHHLPDIPRDRGLEIHLPSPSDPPPASYPAPPESARVRKRAKSRQRKERREARSSGASHSVASSSPPVGAASSSERRPLCPRPPSQRPPPPMRARMESTASSSAQTRPNHEIPEEDIPTQVRWETRRQPASVPPPAPSQRARVQNSISTIPPSRPSSFGTLLGQPLPLRDPARRSAPRPFPFDPPTRLVPEESSLRAQPTLPARRLSLPRVVAVQEAIRRFRLTSLTLGALVVVLGVGSGLMARLLWAGYFSEEKAMPVPTKLREFDIDEPEPHEIVTKVAAEEGLPPPGANTPAPSPSEPPAAAGADHAAEARVSAARIKKTSINASRVALDAASDESEAKPKLKSVALLSDDITVKKAFEGEDAALLQLELKSSRDRSFQEVIALAQGREEQARREANELAHRFVKMDPQSPDEELIDQILEASGDPYAYREAQLGLAEHKSRLGPDLLFEVARRYRGSPTVSEFAQMLLASKSVYRRASRGLQVAIDGWATDDCQDARQLLKRARRVGDRRSVFSLAKFAKTTGCGTNQNEDCFSCLRFDDLLLDSLKKARNRSPRRP